MNNNIIRNIILTVVMAFTASVAMAQVTVRGHVTDDLGEDVIGASVVEKGTGNGTVTDMTGNFSLKVPEGAMLSISYVGFATKEVAAKGGSVIEIQLGEDKQLLNEIVVVGYGAQKKESVIGAISQVDSKDLLATPAANLSHAISGKIPGVITSQTSGAPGADDAQIFIRGRATFAGDAQPLILVDGVERSFSQIAPDDIESISVLKDASATAVYGVRGANGVMLITTKRGKEQKPVVSLTANWQIQSPTRTMDYLGTAESVALLNEAYANDGMTSPYAGYTSDQIASLPDVNWYDEVIRSTAPAQRYNVNVRGGTKRMRYFVSGEFYNQKGLFKELSRDEYGNKSNTSYSRYAFRANLDFDLIKNLLFSVNFGTRFEERNGPNSNESAGYSQVFYNVNHTPSYAFPIEYTLESGKNIYGGTSQYDNVYALLADGGFYKATNTINETNFVVDYKMDWLLKGLKARGMLSFDYDAYYKKLFTKSYATYQLIPGNDPGQLSSYNSFGTNGNLTYAGNNQTTTYKLYMEAQLYWANKFKKHDITAMVLYNQNDYRYQADLPMRYMGLVGRATYGYDEKYLAEVNFGYNGSENFRKGKRFGFFPAFSLGWRITQEKFMESTKDWLTNLKVRVSYGQVGNDQYLVGGVRQRFLYLSQWAQLNNIYLFGATNSVAGVWEAQYANYDVTWEKANKYNAGVEFNFLNGLLSGSFDYFYEKRDNILTTYQTKPEWLGVAVAAGNLGETKNSGIELELHHCNKIGKDFNYNVDFTFSHAKNEIVSRDEAPGMTSYRKTEGHPIGQFYGLVADGFITQADIDGGNLPRSAYTDNLQPGDLKYRDMNNDGFIDERDQTFIGYSDVPENTYAISLGCSWKGLGMSVMFQGVSHVSRYYDAEAMYAFVNGGRVRPLHLGRWNPALSEAENLAHATYPLLHYDAYGNHNQQQNSFFLQNGSFFRLKNIEVYYDLPQKWIKKLAMTQCRVYVNANNLVTWDHLDNINIDPESSGSNKYPIMKAINFGINVQF